MTSLTSVAMDVATSWHLVAEPESCCWLFRDNQWPFIITTGLSKTTTDISDTTIDFLIQPLAFLIQPLPSCLTVVIFTALQELLPSTGPTWGHPQNLHQAPTCLLQTHTVPQSSGHSHEAQLIEWKMPKQKELQKTTLIFWIRSMPLFTFGNLAQHEHCCHQNNASKQGNSLSTLFNNLVVLYIW